MAVVRDKSGNTRQDKEYATPNRNNAGSPIGSLTPAYANELVMDTTNSKLYRAVGPTNTDWIGELVVVQ